jgi:hypothetical protein
MINVIKIDCEEVCDKTKLAMVDTTKGVNSLRS